MSSESGAQNAQQQQTPPAPQQGTGTPEITFNISSNPSPSRGIPSDLSDVDFTMNQSKPDDLTGVDMRDDLNAMGQQQLPAQEAAQEESPAESQQAQEGAQEAAKGQEGQQEGQQEEQGGTDPYADWSVSAKFAAALGEQGFSLYEEGKINKELDPGTLVQDIQKRNNEFMDIRVNQTLQQLGPLAEYVQFIYRGGNMDDIQPAIQNQRYADFDVNNENVTEDQLESLAREMYVKKGIKPERADEYISIAKEKGRLKEEALESKQFHADLVTTMKENAKEAYELQEQQKQAAIQQESKAFEKVLRSGKIAEVITVNNDEASALWDFMYKRDQPIDSQDPQGNPKRDFVTAYELKMYEAVNNPEKLAFLSWLAMNDFNPEALMGLAKSKVSSNIFKAIDNPNQQPPAQGQQQQQGNKQPQFRPVHSFTL